LATSEKGCWTNIGKKEKELWPKVSPNLQASGATIMLTIGTGREERGERTKKPLGVRNIAGKFRYGTRSGGPRFVTRPLGGRERGYLHPSLPGWSAGESAKKTVRRGKDSTKGGGERKTGERGGKKEKKKKRRGGEKTKNPQARQTLTGFRGGRYTSSTLTPGQKGAKKDLSRPVNPKKVAGRIVGRGYTRNKKNRAWCVKVVEGVRGQAPTRALTNNLGVYSDQDRPPPQKRALSVWAGRFHPWLSGNFLFVQPAEEISRGRWLMVHEESATEKGCARGGKKSPGPTLTTPKKKPWRRRGGPEGAESRGVRWGLHKPSEPKKHGKPAAADSFKVWLIWRSPTQGSPAGGKLGRAVQPHRLGPVNPRGPLGHPEAPPVRWWSGLGKPPPIKPNPAIPWAASGPKSERPAPSGLHPCFLKPE